MATITQTRLYASPSGNIENISNSHSHSHFCLSFYPPANPHSKLLCADAPKTASRRNRGYVPTQRAIRGDAAQAASPRSWKGKTCHIMLTDLTFNLMAIKLMAVKLGGREWI